MAMAAQALAMASPAAQFRASTPWLASARRGHKGHGAQSPPFGGGPGPTATKPLPLQIRPRRMLATWTGLRQSAATPLLPARDSEAQILANATRGAVETPPAPPVEVEEPTTGSPPPPGVGNGNGGNGGGGGGGGGLDWVPNVGLFLCWAGFCAYAFLLSPNQTPYRDQIYLEIFLKLRNDGDVLNAVFVNLFNVMGLIPFVLASLVIPTGRSKLGVPVWPFATLSMFLGAFAWLPYFALWQPRSSPVSVNEAQALPVRILDSKVFAALLFGGLLFLESQMVLAAADGDTGMRFFQLFEESRFVHVTTLDFITLSLSFPFWAYNDMLARNWEAKDSWGLYLACFPFIGAPLYLLLRPSLQDTAKADS